MPEKQTAAADPLCGGSFSRLLFSDDDIEDAVTAVGLNHRNTDVSGAGDRFRFCAGEKTPKMLCFGADSFENSIVVNGASADSTTTDNNTANSSSPSSATNSTTTSLSSTSNRKRNVGCNYYQPVVLQGSLTSGGGGSPAPAKSVKRNCKKMKSENTPPAGHAKVKKEKLGERIAALQQLVSPYGKTDTASVLHEAMGYIRFLQEQVQVLCSPYLQGLPSSSSTHLVAKEKGGCGEAKKDLRSRGLCLVPVECTLHVADSINGADFWSPAMVNSHGSSSQH